LQVARQAVSRGLALPFQGYCHHHFDRGQHVQGFLYSFISLDTDTTNELTGNDIDLVLFVFFFLLFFLSQLKGTPKEGGSPIEVNDVEVFPNTNEAVTNWQKISQHLSFKYSKRMGILVGPVDAVAMVKPVSYRCNI